MAMELECFDRALEVIDFSPGSCSGGSSGAGPEESQALRSSSGRTSCTIASTRSSTRARSSWSFGPRGLGEVRQDHPHRRDHCRRGPRGRARANVHRLGRHRRAVFRRRGYSQFQSGSCDLFAPDEDTALERCREIGQTLAGRRTGHGLQHRTKPEPPTYSAEVLLGVVQEVLYNSELDAMMEDFEPSFKLWTAAIELKHAKEELLKSPLHQGPRRRDRAGGRGAVQGELQDTEAVQTPGEPPDRS